MAVRYLSEEEVKRVFGDPAPYADGAGGISPKWERKIITSFFLPEPLPYCADRSILIERVRCHKRIAPFMQAALQELHDSDGVWGSINDFGGCYNWRTQRKSKNLSRHSWGIALDIDVTDNPMGTPGEMNKTAITIFRSYGFLWGGDFRSRKDPMHFEFGDLEMLEGEG
jgi:hypothetical protein